ncbi:hypothetical protein UlMin_022019 [Ulmus minor]
MVWFQCEDCGDDLKKPKLPNHFRICSASKLSCIDCGETFGQQNVQSHNQCITETEKYGPKGQGKAPTSATPKPNKDAKQQPDFDLNVGLSDRSPWFCSICNTKATSKQTLLLHAEGKKHKAKARAIHAAKQPPKQTEESAPASENPPKDEVDKKNVEAAKVQDVPKVDSGDNNVEASNGNLPSKKKRKNDNSDDAGLKKKTKDERIPLDNGEVIQGEKTEAQEKESKLKNEESKTKIKWKKLITSSLKSNPDGVLKMKKLRKLVLKAIQESGITGDESELSNTLEHKINSSSRFTVEKKYVRLVAKD